MTVGRVKRVLSSYHGAWGILVTSEINLFSLKIHKNAMLNSIKTIPGPRLFNHIKYDYS